MGRKLDRRGLLKNLLWMLILAAAITLYYLYLDGELRPVDGLFLSGVFFLVLGCSVWSAGLGSLTALSMGPSACWGRRSRTSGSILMSIHIRNGIRSCFFLVRCLSWYPLPSGRYFNHSAFMSIL